MSEKTLRACGSIDEVNENQWNNVVEQSDRGSVFHRSGWLRAVEEGLGYEPRHLVLEKKGNPLGLIPNFVTGIDLPIPFANRLDGFGTKRVISVEPGFGGPVIQGDERANFDLLFNHVNRLLSDRDTVYHRVKTVDSDFMRYATQFAEHGYQPETTSCRFVIDLERGWDAIESNMDSSKRSNLEDARDSAGRVRHLIPELTDLNEFYETYEQAMTRVNGLVYPFSFFEALHEHFQDRLKLFTVDVDGEFAGGFLYLLDEERSSMHCFFHGLDSDYYRYHPSEQLDEYAMKWGIERGYDEYDLGSTRADFDDGAFRYKNELGAEIRPILSWEKGCSTFRWPVYRLGRQFVRSRA